VIAEFRSFLLNTNALALAIGVILGTALGAVVSSLVNDIVMPPIGAVLGGVDFSQLVLTVGDVDIRYGAFINTLIVFVIVAWVVFWIGRTFIKSAPEPEPVPMKICPFCREQVHAEATRCSHCQSVLTAEAAG
jgi:large conductance mechanosensitive channel